MEEERHRDLEGTFERLIIGTRNKEKVAMEQLLALFERDIQELARFIKMPREDAVQTLKTDFLEVIQTGEMQGRSE